MIDRPEFGGRSEHGKSRLGVTIGDEIRDELQAMYEIHGSCTCTTSGRKNIADLIHHQVPEIRIILHGSMRQAACTRKDTRPSGIETEW